MSLEQRPSVSVHGSLMDLSQTLNQKLLALSRDALSQRSQFTLAVSGGSLPSILALAWPASLTEEEASQWHVFFADERCVPLDSPDSNFRLFQKEILSKSPHLNVHSMSPDCVHDPQEAATAYEEQIKRVLGSNNAMPSLDVLLLGMGPDGHTCSLFPHHPLLALQETDPQKMIASLTDSPKSPPSRITLTLSAVNAAKRALFVVTGQGKAPVLKEILENNSQEYPAGLGELVFSSGVSDKIMNG